MKKTINIIIGILFGLTPILGWILFSVLIYNYLSNVFGVLLIVGLLALAIWQGVNLFKMVQILGPLGLLSASNSSPDADNLIPERSSDTNLLNPNEFAQLIKSNENRLKGGHLYVFGYDLREIFKEDLIFQDAHFDTIDNILTLHFIGEQKFAFYNPKHIFETSTFIRIVSADRVELTFTNSFDKELQFIDCQKQNKKIVINTNLKRLVVKGYIGEPALSVIA